MPTLTAVTTLLLLLFQAKGSWSWSPQSFTASKLRRRRDRAFTTLRGTTSSPTTATSWFGANDIKTQQVQTTGTTEATASITSLDRLKAQVLQLGAALDRGQAYNPTSGEYYNETMQVAKAKIAELIQVGSCYNAAAISDGGQQQLSLKDMEGEWELVLTTVPHGIFRSSPFFLAIQEAYAYAEDKESFGVDKATLFFRLHELQTCSWGVSKVGRVAQRIDADAGYLYSEFDTSIFALTVIPILGWFKLLPTFGGCVVTATKCQLVQQPSSSTPELVTTTTTSTDNDSTPTTDWVLDMEVDYTTSLPVPGLNGLGEWIWKVRIPVGQIWKWLPWNKGRAATCRVWLRYLDDDFRIVQDVSGDYFCYTRPVVSRPFTLEK